MYRIIALDVDGVLNNDFTQETINGYCGVDDYLVERLAKIAAASGAKIILTSTWKRDIIDETAEGLYLMRKLNKYNLNIDYISDDDNKHRGKYLINNLNRIFGEDNYNYVILDDCPFDYFIEGDIRKHLVITDERIGLTEEDVKKAIEILVKE